MRSFETGATRDNDEGKHDIEGFYSPIVIHRFAEYMTKNRVQSDGKLRDSDNWQKGMPINQYMKSLSRHYLDVWLEHREFKGRDDIEEALCGLLFNAQGMLFELLKKRGYMKKTTDVET